VCRGARRRAWVAHRAHNASWRTGTGTANAMDRVPAPALAPLGAGPGRWDRNKEGIVSVLFLGKGRLVRPRRRIVRLYRISLT
jgi:hypothetical protein